MITPPQRFFIPARPEAPSLSESYQVRAEVLEKRRKGFVQPNRVPIGRRYQVTKPLVTEFMRHHGRNVFEPE